MKMKTNSLTVMLIRHLIISILPLFFLKEKIINENENEILIYLNLFAQKKTLLFNNSYNITL